MAVVTCALAGAVLPASAVATPTVTEFSAGITAGSGPGGIVAGPDGNLWFTESSDRIGRITPAGVVTEFSAGITAGSSPGGIAAGPDGNLWFTENGGDRIARITPAGVVTEFSTGITAGSGLTEIVAGPDGNLWFTENSGNRIGRITPAGVVTEFPIPSANSGPQGITAGPDGNLWFTEGGVDRIGRITPAGAVTEFSTGITPRSGPQGIATGPDGNLWFTEAGTSIQGVGRITPAGVVTEFSMRVEPDSSPFGIAAGPDGNLWFTEFNRPQVGRITLSGVVTEFPLPSRNSTSVEIAAGPDGNLWFTESNRFGPRADKIGRVTADLPPVVATGAASGVSQSAATVAGSVNARSEATTVSFQYGTTTAYGSSSAAQDAGAGSTPVGVSGALGGLARGTVYHYRAVASNGSGTSYGADATFTTSPASPLSGGLTSTGTDTSTPGVSSYGVTNSPFVVSGAKTPTFGSAARATRHKKGTRFKYTLSEAATVRIVISQRRSGRRHGIRCVAPRRSLRKKAKCIRLTRKGTLTRTSHKGANSVAFSGRIGSKALSPGTYSATITAADAAKNTSGPKTISFSIVKR